MTGQWITNHLPLDESAKNVILLGDENYVVSVDTLATITQNVTDENESYANLSSSTLVFNGQNITPKESGWQTIFDDWKAKGIIN